MPEPDESHSRINIQTLGIGWGAPRAHSRPSSCDQDSFLVMHTLASARKWRLAGLGSDRCFPYQEVLASDKTAFI